MEKKEYLEIGKIVNTHGVDGRIIVETWCDSAEVFTKLKRVFFKSGSSYVQKDCSSSVHKGRALCKLADIDNIDDAIKLKNRVVYAKREDISISPGARFIADLIGLPVIDSRDGRQYGVLKDITVYSSSDIYVVSCSDGRERMMPAVSEFVDHITDDAVFVKPISGMLDDGFEQA